MEALRSMVFVYLVILSLTTCLSLAETDKDQDVADLLKELQKATRLRLIKRLLDLLETYEDTSEDDIGLDERLWMQWNKFDSGSSGTTTKSPWPWR